MSLVGKRCASKRVDEQIAGALREAIRAGRILHGSTLPSTQELARELKANLNSVNRALALLAAEGFLERRRHFGTVVTSPERKQRRVVCLIGQDLKMEAFFVGRVLFRLLEEELARRNCRVRCIDKLAALASPKREIRDAAIDTLLEELEHYPPTAFIFYSFVLERYPELKDYYSIPGVSVQKGPVRILKEQLLEEGLRYLSRQGCKRVVLVTFSSVLNPDRSFFQLFWATLKSCRMEAEGIVELYDNELRERTTEECQFRITKLLEARARKPAAERFDALIVGDDTAMRGAATALLKAGIDVPSEIRVLVQTNRGIDHHYGLHVDRLELPLDKSVKALLDALDSVILAPSKPVPEKIIRRVLKPATRPA